jgi:murein L,D-transpeptidase YafK
LNPEGHKQEEGDFRTPEGRYRLAGRNERSDFFLSIAVSYPDQTDRQRAKAAGVSPGGFIMVHGLPNQPRWPPEYYASRDWTDGCIALSNSDMMELWMLVGDNIPIDIRP